MGTSLNVSPANLLPTAVRPDCVRVVCNREMVGEEFGLGSSSRDYFLQGDCDEVSFFKALQCSLHACFLFSFSSFFLKVLLDLIESLGWLPDLAAYKNDMCPASKQLVEKRIIA